MTGFSTPSSTSTSVFVLAYGKPVSSLTGKASVSARRRTVGPGPLERIPMRPVPPMEVRTLKEGRERRWVAAVVEARCSWRERPGFWCRFL